MSLKCLILLVISMSFVCEVSQSLNNSEIANLPPIIQPTEWLIVSPVTATSSQPPVTEKRRKILVPLPKFSGTEDYLIQTVGCSIPNYARTIPYEEATDWKIACDKRLVFVSKTGEDEVTFNIDYRSINLKRRRFICCYKFAIRSTSPGQEDDFLRFSKCRRFTDGTVVKLKEEIITVSCGLHYKKRNFTVLMYKDAYLMLKRKPTPSDKDTKDWNVLILGMDSMSRGRAYNSIPKVVQYFKDQEWLDFRGFNKIDYNTFPNLMAMLTGRHPNKTTFLCDQGIERCRNMLIWNRFKEAGYMTAFGEESRTSTFTPFGGFRIPPTDHYARSFFTLKDYTRGNTVCLRTKPSSLRLLNYAKQFIDAYYEDNFFGLFWLSYFSHSNIHLPATSEKMLLLFFEHLQQIGVFKNTFVFFLSDHGFNYGVNRISKESYYDSRLPMFFMWVPRRFRRQHTKTYYSLEMNQHRLVTPYDVHATLWKILTMGDETIEPIPPEACGKCHSLFTQISKYRTCKDVNIDEVWCTCHRIKQTPKTEDYDESLKTAVKYVQKAARYVKTAPCTSCLPITLRRAIRNHWYKRGMKLFFIVAFIVAPMELAYESIVKKAGKDFEVISTRTITPYNPKSTCVMDKYAGRAYCVCENTC